MPIRKQIDGLLQPTGSAAANRSPNLPALIDGAAYRARTPGHSFTYQSLSRAQTDVYKRPLQHALDR